MSPVLRNNHLLNTYFSGLFEHNQNNKKKGNGQNLIQIKLIIMYDFHDFLFKEIKIIRFLNE